MNDTSGLSVGSRLGTLFPTSSSSLVSQSLVVVGIFLSGCMRFESPLPPLSLKDYSGQLCLDDPKTWLSLRLSLSFPYFLREQRLLQSVLL